MSGLQAQTQTRLHRLEESKKLHQFLREAEETADLINDQLHTAAGEDYGKDFEHLEVLVCRAHVICLEDEEVVLSWSLVKFYLRFYSFFIF